MSDFPELAGSTESELRASVRAPSHRSSGAAPGVVLDALGCVTGVPVRSRLATYVNLTKPRIAGMVLVATALGFYLALPSTAGMPVLPLLAHTLLGTGLVAAGANALNQVLEAPYDRKMARTRCRPIPSGHLASGEALSFAFVLSLVGLVELALFVNLSAGLVAASALVSYVLMYTPLKRRSSHSVFVGAVSGALPPVIGWSAGAGSPATGAVVLFLIMYFWQLPHFAAIAWLYREDYRRAGFPVLPVVNPAGGRTDRQMIVHSLGLVIVSLLPAVLGLAGGAYAIGATILGLAFFACGVFFVHRKTKEAARFHLLATVVYLPSLFALMMIDKTPVV